MKASRNVVVSQTLLRTAANAEAYEPDSVVVHNCQIVCPVLLYVNFGTQFVNNFLGVLLRYDRSAHISLAA